MDPKDNQKLGGNKRKGINNNCKCGNTNKNNKDKENQNNDNFGNNVGYGNKEKWKVMFPWKLCKEDNFKNLCPKIEEALRLISQQPALLTNILLHNQIMASGTLNTRNTLGGGQNPLTHDGVHQCVNMVQYEIIIATKTRDYGPSQPTLGKYHLPSKTPLHIINLDHMTRITKGLVNHSAHNKNSKANKNYSIFKYLGQTLCVMSSLDIIQTCQTHRNALLYMLGDLDSSGFKVIKFYVRYV
jgi:hypothetical protein